MIMKRSAMGEQQRMAILSNELVRRLSNVQISIVYEEMTEILEHYTHQLKTSGYDRKQTKEIICCGVVGWKRKVERREREGRGFYRHAKATLKHRNKKKLREKSTWFKEKRKREEDEDADVEIPARKRGPGEMQKTAKPVMKDGKMQQIDVKTVMFIPFTQGGQLAKKLRDAEEKLGSITGYRMKMVERAGDKLEDLLTRADPWQGLDCGRAACLLCQTKQKTSKNLNQDCHTRSLVYETWCMSCMQKEEAKIEEKYEGDARKIKEEKGKIKKHLYIGETSRSIYERTLEHQGDVDQLKPSSHMLRHMIEMHRGEERSQIEFGVKVLRYSRKSFERQILESVLIQACRDHHILNSRSEFNRCAIPRLVTKLGDKELKLWRQKDREMQETEERVEEQIRLLRKAKNKERAAPGKKEPRSKRQRLDEEGRETTETKKGSWIIPDAEKRKDAQIERTEVPDCPAAKKMKRNDIRYFINSNKNISSKEDSLVLKDQKRYAFEGVEETCQERDAVLLVSRPEVNAGLETETRADDDVNPGAGGDQPRADTEAAAADKPVEADVAAVPAVPVPVRVTQTITLCHTIPWPVARSVPFHENNIRVGSIKCNPAGEMIMTDEMPPPVQTDQDQEKDVQAVPGCVMAEQDVPGCVMAEQDVPGMGSARQSDVLPGMRSAGHVKLVPDQALQVQSDPGQGSAEHELPGLDLTWITGSLEKKSKDVMHGPGKTKNSSNVDKSGVREGEMYQHKSGVREGEMQRSRVREGEMKFPMIVMNARPQVGTELCEMTARSPGEGAGLSEMTARPQAGTELCEMTARSPGEEAGLSEMTAKCQDKPLSDRDRLRKCWKMLRESKLMIKSLE